MRQLYQGKVSPILACTERSSFIISIWSGGRNVCSWSGGICCGVIASIYWSSIDIDAVCKSPCPFYSKRRCCRRLVRNKQSTSHRESRTSTRHISFPAMGDARRCGTCGRDKRHCDRSESFRSPQSTRLLKSYLHVSMLMTLFLSPFSFVLLLLCNF